MMHGSSPRGSMRLLRSLLFVLAASILAATFIAYLNPDALISFASLRLC